MGDRNGPVGDSCRTMGKVAAAAAMSAQEEGLLRKLTATMHHVIALPHAAVSRVAEAIPNRTNDNADAIPANCLNTKNNQTTASAAQPESLKAPSQVSSRFPAVLF